MEVKFFIRHWIWWKEQFLFLICYLTLHLIYEQNKQIKMNDNYMQIFARLKFYIERIYRTKSIEFILSQIWKKMEKFLLRFRNWDQN